MPAHLQLNELLKALMRQYKHQVPQFDAIIAAVSAQQKSSISEYLLPPVSTAPVANLVSELDDNLRVVHIENDHFALRSFGYGKFGIKSLEDIFLPLGYERRDAYFFAEKKLRAHWYSPPIGTNFPRIFISELIVEELSSQSQSIIRRYLDEAVVDTVAAVATASTAATTDATAATTTSAVTSNADFFLQLPWKCPTVADYEALLSESEYASWVLCHGHAMNHFTIAVHNLHAPLNTAAAFNDWIEQQLHIPLNASGGKLKVSGDGLLIQSSTMAQQLQYRFADGEVRKIPGSFVEFAERLVLPDFAAEAAAAVANQQQVPAHCRREGFEVANADKIFESTYS